ncbi:MAG TPA: HlyD family efflux transporter periplasmic adaptor subunit [Solirubrobacteraceae bacterium]|jgi:multidrug resistance efflux pump|nr:HlyD family efflux transporter periplasmic adaptor subunit [Solirubrobacteraceae bacterium]
MTKRTGSPWLNYLLGLLCVGAIAAAILLVGPASGSTTAVTRTAKAAEGVVQSTVSGSGNLQPASQLDLGFKTSGTVTKIYMSQGEYVTEGKLIAELNPQSAEVTLEQSKATLLSAEANLVKEEETDGEGTTGSGGSASGGASAAAASVHPIDAEKKPESEPSTAPSTSPTEPTHTTTTPSATSTEPTHTTTSKTTVPQGKREESQSSGSSSRENESSGSSSKATVSAATREANLASARAAVKSDRLTVQSDEEAVGATKLYAPQNGTIVSLSGQVGEVVSGSGTTKASSSSSSSSSGSGSSATGSSAVTGRSASGASSSSSSGSGSSASSSSAFAVLSDLSSMQLVVALSESEIGNVKVGQIATVTVEALESRKLAAHVSEVATLSTSSSGVVSYDVTFQLDQMEAGLKPGMSATAEVVVKQAEGVNVPTTAISADSVTVVRDGKDVRQRVVTGLAGNTSTIVVSGLKAGETVVLPAATSTSSSTSLTSRLSRLAGGGGGLGGGAAGGGGFGGGGGAAFFRGGGG